MELHAFITGRVQGVWYRQSAREVAQNLGLAGWVANLRDGRVEVHAFGPLPQLEALLAWLKQGPPLARVENVDYTLNEGNSTEVAGFSIKF